ncbi:DUF4346 domain-containing protein [Leptolyngbya boryana]
MKCLRSFRNLLYYSIDHAAYLGREFVRAESCLFGDQEYVQD